MPHIGFLHARIGAQIGEAPFGEAFALHQHHDVIAQRRDQAHVVLDDQEGDAARLQRQNVLAELLRQGRIDAGGRLVEHDQLRLGHQGAAELQQLLLAAREIDRAIVADVQQVELARDFDRALAQLLLARARRGGAQHGGAEGLARLMLAVQHQVLDHGELREPARDLEGAREPDRRRAGPAASRSRRCRRTSPRRRSAAARR